MVEKNFKNEYNEKYSIPEMINTFKTISSKIYKDILWLFAIIYYIYFIKFFKIPGVDDGIKYEGYNCIILLIIIVLFFLSLLSHLNKIFIIYRQLDDELKYKYQFSDEPKIRERLDAAANMTAFVISNNFITDYIITGRNRQPSLRKMLFIYFVIMIVFTIISTKIVIDITSVDPWFSLLFTFPVVLAILYYLLSYNYVARSSFLAQAEMKKDLFETYADVINKINVNLETKDSNNELSNFINLTITSKEKFYKIPFENVFDDNSSYLLIKDLVVKFQTEWNKLNEGNKLRIYLPFSLNREISFRGRNIDGSEYFERFIKFMNNQIKVIDSISKYSLCLKFNKVRYVESNNIFTFLFYCIKMKIV